MNRGPPGGSDTAVTTRSDLRDLLELGARRAAALAEPVLVSHTRPAPHLDPLDFFARGREVAAERGYWHAPAAGLAIAGIGAAWSVTGLGRRRFADVGRAWQRLLADAAVEAPGDGVSAGRRATGPVLLGGFAFDPLRPRTETWSGYPDGWLFLPRYTLISSGGATWFTVNALVDRDADPALLAEGIERARRLLLDAPRAPVSTEPGSGAPPAGAAEGGGLQFAAADPAGWMERVAEFAAEVRSGRLGKVVLAREEQARAARPFSPDAVLRDLADGNPGGYLFAFARGDRCFLGASPEQLADLSEGRVRTMCLAGSIGRGAMEEEDRALGEALLASAKDRREHAVVVAALRDGLAPLCAELHVAEEPSLLKLRHVQHLFTPVSGRLERGRTILDVIERIHPTPAVGGFPREAALELIRAREGMDRGWYAGPVGWIDRFGEGEFAVAIRSALLRGDQASLFAGCGIMGDSDPESEYRESCLKLKGMRLALERSLR